MESSSSTDDPGVRVGRLGRPKGLKGFLGLYVDDADLYHFQIGSTVSVNGRDHTVRSLRRGNKGPEVAFEEVTDREQAEAIRGMDVYVPERRPLQDDEFWPEQLVGLSVRPGGGEVVEVAHGPAQDRLVVLREGIRFEVPFVSDLVPVVDLDRGFVEIVEIEGLSEPEDRK